MFLWNLEWNDVFVFTPMVGGQGVSSGLKVVLHLNTFCVETIIKAGLLAFDTVNYHVRLLSRQVPGT